MSNTVTALTLWNKALDYADMTGSSFPDTTRKFDMLNAAMNRLHYTLAAAESEYVVATPSSISVVANTALYALPTTFYKALKMYRVEGNRRFIVRRFSREMVDGALAVPSSSQTWELHYIPHVTLFTADGDTVAATYPPGSEDFIAMDVAARLLAREESFEAAGYWEKKANQLLAEFRELYGAPRDVGEVHVVDDVYGRFADPYKDMIAEPAHTRMYYRIEGSNIRVIEVDPARGV